MPWPPTTRLFLAYGGGRPICTDSSCAGSDFAKLTLCPHIFGGQFEVQNEPGACSADSTDQC